MRIEQQQQGILREWENKMTEQQQRKQREGGNKKSYQLQGILIDEETRGQSSSSREYKEKGSTIRHSSSKKYIKD